MAEPSQDPSEIEDQLQKIVDGNARLQQYQNNSALSVTSSRTLDAGYRSSTEPFTDLLYGPDLLFKPFVYFAKPKSPTKSGGKDGTTHRLLAFFYMGRRLCGHPGIIHGGMIATLLDECLSAVTATAAAGEGALQGMLTVTLDLEYRATVKAESIVCVHAWVTSNEDGMVTVEGEISDAEDEKKVLTKAKAIFVIKSAV